MYKKLIFIAIIIFIIGFFGYHYIYQEHRDISKEQAAYVLDAEELLNHFTSMPQKAEKKYLNKTLAVKGKVTSQQGNALTLNGHIFCQFEKLPEGISPQTILIIKGRCIGFDDLLEEVKLDQCSLPQ